MILTKKFNRVNILNDIFNLLSSNQQDTHPRIPRTVTYSIFGGLKLLLNRNTSVNNIINGHFPHFDASLIFSPRADNSKNARARDVTLF